ncbi:MAG: PPOX class F420-dependent oxidoreductase [Chloroflexi bacterium]|nr:PPOX class F420-dependent oxidoreductase [Chloroflexota bacterium]
MPKTDRISQGGVKLLQEPQTANFVTLMPDGSPQVTPVWIDVEPDGSALLINTAEGRVKANNVERDKRVAISVFDKNNPWRYVLVRGTIADRTHEGADALIDKLAKKYLGQDTYPFRKPEEQRVTLVIKPHHVIELGTE